MIDFWFSCNLKLLSDGDDEFDGHGVQVVRQGQGRVHHESRICQGSNLSLDFQTFSDHLNARINGKKK